jgi:hypothetical protein
VNARETLLAAIPDDIYPRVTAEEPVRIECLSPDSEEKLTLEGQTVSLELDIYTILLVK